MKLEEIKSALKKGKEIIFSPDPEGLHYIWADTALLEVTFTTDVPDYKSTDLDGLIELFYEKFQAVDFKVKVHIHKGKKHDKDITIKLIKNSELVKLSRSVKNITTSNESDIDRVAGLVYFVINHFYEVKNWKHKTLTAL